MNAILLAHFVLDRDRVMDRFTSRHASHGYTLVEMIVSISILGLLTAILLPAIQSTREAARQVECRNHLHQIGIASHGFEESQRVFPSSRNARSLLELYTIEDQLIGNCPSDSWHDGGDIVNYFVNDGTVFAGAGTKRNGFRVWGIDDAGVSRETSNREITDGLSQTAAWSERLSRARSVLNSAPASTPASQLLIAPIRYNWYLPQSYATAESAADACETARVTPFPYTYGSEELSYRHMLGPNRISCMNFSAPPAADPSSQLITEFYMTSATSEHPGHVNVLFADGSVHVVSDNIEIGMWRALATRNGNESVIVGF